MHAIDVCGRAQLILNDAGVHWPVEPDLRTWLNDARRDASWLRPDLFSVMGTLAATTNGGLVAGQAQQATPDSWWRIMDVVRNTNGPAITVQQKEVMDAFDPGWMLPRRAQRIVLHWMNDERDVDHFWLCYPPAAGASIEVLYVPTPLAILSGQVNDYEMTPQEESVVSALVDFVCYRAFMKDSELGQGERALAHYQQAQAFLTTGRAVLTAVNANQANWGAAGLTGGGQ